MLARFIIISVLVLTACSKHKQSELPAEVISSEDIRITITPSAKSIRTCDLLEISVELSYPQSYKVKLPDSKDKFGDFSIYQINQNSPVAINEKLNSLSQIIILEPGLSSVHKIPKLSFIFWNEKNIQSVYKSKALSIDVTSSLNSNNNNDLKDIITETGHTNHTVSIIGTIALLITIIYLLFFCKLEEDTTDRAVNEALSQFHDLARLNENELLNEIPRSGSLFLKEKFNLQKLPNNLDIIIKELALKKDFASFSKRLEQLYSTYIKLRYSSGSVEKDAALELHTAFDSLFQELQS